MLRKFAAASAAIAGLLASSPAWAGIYTDDFAKCLVKSTSQADQQALVVWVFAAMAQHPDVAAYAKVSPAQLETESKRTAAMMQKLMLQSCRTEFVAALKYEGGNAAESAFGVLGQVAFRGLMTDPNVAKALENLGKHSDPEAFAAAAKEAGIPTPETK